MPVTYQLSVGSGPVSDDFYTALQSLEVEENADAPDALLLRLPVTRTPAGDLNYVGDRTFAPGTPVSLVATPLGQATQCIFDGYALAWKLHLDRATTASTLEVWAQDASWLMNIDEKVKEWSGQTDGQVANAIFESHGFAAAAANTADDSPPHQAADHTLLQRDTDLRFLRGLARRSGKILRVTCAATPGVRTGVFVTPQVSAAPAATISLVDPAAWDTDTLDFSWDVMRPTEVQASQISFGDSSGNGVPGDTDSSGLAPMDALDLASYSGQGGTALLTAAADPLELPHRTAGLLREAGWLVRCEGTVDAERIGTLLRVGTVVSIEGAGTLHSGNWFVWSVRHVITQDAYRMRFTLVRNAMGPAEAGLPLSLPPIPGL
jgi:Phage tail baseplate hub (GPD)